jgi:hypothetical protein
VDAGNMVWVGARSGNLYRFDGEIWIRYAQPRSASGALLDTRAYPAADWALLGPTPVRDDGGTWSRFTDWDSSAVAVDVAQSPSGEWYTATRDRLFRYDGSLGKWQPVSPGGSGASRGAWKTPADITAIAFDGVGRLFVGTEDGFGCLSAGKLHWWNAGDGIGGERVTDLAVDASTLWVGYGEDGFSALPLADVRPENGFGP